MIIYVVYLQHKSTPRKKPKSTVFMSSHMSFEAVASLERGSAHFTGEGHGHNVAALNMSLHHLSLLTGFVTHATGISFVLQLVTHAADVGI